MEFDLNKRPDKENCEYSRHILSYLKKTSFILALVFFFSLFLTTNGIYRPLLKEIEKNSLDYFQLLAEARMDTFRENINKNIQAAKSLSSRSDIRDISVSFLDGNIGSRELQYFTSGRYLDGVVKIEDLAYAVRLVEGEEVAGIYNHLDIKYIMDKDYDKIKKVRIINYNIIKRGEISYLDVISPIYAGSRIAGYDLVGFNLEGVIRSLNTDDAKFHIEYNLGVSSGKNKPKFEELKEADGNIYFIKEFIDDIGLVVSQPSNITFKNRDTLKDKSFNYIFIGYGVILIIVFLLLGLQTNKSIKNLSIDRDIYKKYADMDTLTGAFSRLFLDMFAKEYPYSKGTLILIDMDKFKNTNDKHGHMVGDEVLKYFVYRIKKVIRGDDLVIRYGGDEFLIILRDNTEERVAIDLINRVKIDLKKQNHFNFTIGFSYGIAIIESMLDINMYIQEADEKMYLNKQNKKILKENIAYEL